LNNYNGNFIEVWNVIDVCFALVGESTMDIVRIHAFHDSNTNTGKGVAAPRHRRVFDNSKHTEPDRPPYREQQTYRAPLKPRKQQSARRDAPMRVRPTQMATQLATEGAEDGAVDVCGFRRPFTIHYLLFNN
jgi:hypothetical protein